MITASSSSTTARLTPLPAAANPVPAKTPTAAEQAVAALADAKLQAARDAVAKLKTAPTQGSATRTALAKLDALKERLKMLMMMGGDPQTVARQAAQIAKEIAQAAKDYVAAGGSPSAAPVTPASPAPAQASTADAKDGGTAAGGAEASADPATGAPSTSDGATDATATADPSSGTAKGDADAQTPQPTAAATAAPAASTPPPSGPDRVMAEAKILAASAKSVLQAAIQRAKREHPSDDLKSDQDKMDQADKDLDKAAKTLADQNAPAAYSAGGQAVAAPAADPAPQVSVKA